MRPVLISILMLIMPGLLFAMPEENSASRPKREFRGAWIATVINLDWPSAPGLSTAKQQQELIEILDELHRVGANAAIFQIRSEADAMYASDLEPWSFWLTGRQGKAPDPYYDPLEFAVREAHARGIELHAWFNPYRAQREIGNYTIDEGHVIKESPEWILTFDRPKLKLINPGHPDARDYIVRVIMDVVRRYDIDGVHMDDYFYPYPDSRFNFNGITTEDNQTFADFNRGFTNRADWRRDNINLLIAAINDSIQATKPWVKFGMSPFGIWKNGVPSGVGGLDAYRTLYADAVAWLNAQSVDYLTPQLYWPFGGGQDYGKLQPWWASQMNGRHFYPGQAAYRINSWPSGEIRRQIDLNRDDERVQGSIFFRAENFFENPKGFTDLMANNLWLYPALAPQMAWKDSIAPNPPAELEYAPLAETGRHALQWNLPETATDGDSATRYVVYRFRTDAVSAADLDNPTKILDITGTRSASPISASETGDPFYFLVTALDRNSNESQMSNIIQVMPPTVPLATAPTNNAVHDSINVLLAWQETAPTASFQVQMATDSAFAEEIFNETGIETTEVAVNALEGQQDYFWRVRATNAGGRSSFTEASSFTTGYPATPVLATPTNFIRGIALDTTFTWHPAQAAESYAFEIASKRSFVDSTVFLRSEGIADTSLQVSGLDADRFYYWRVRATNTVGTGLWSDIFRIKTAVLTGIADLGKLPGRFQLSQNYPNPFNPSTTISFELAKAGHVTLKVFDLLGREVAALIDEPRQAGLYRVHFDAHNLPSGVYVYQLIVDGSMQSRRMMLLK